MKYKNTDEIQRLIDEHGDTLYSIYETNYKSGYKIGVCIGAGIALIGCMATKTILHKVKSKQIKD